MALLEAALPVPIMAGENRGEKEGGPEKKMKNSRRFVFFWTCQLMEFHRIPLHQKTRFLIFYNNILQENILHGLTTYVIIRVVGKSDKTRDSANVGYYWKNHFQ